MWIFKKKEKINAKFKKDEFVAFHMNNDLKHGVIKNIRKIDDSIIYDINVGGEASWIAKSIAEDKILKIKKEN